MSFQLVIIHRPLGEGSKKPFVAVSSGAVWSTCLRSIAIGGADLYASQLQRHDQVFTGRDAYEFLLEVVCGLHSPVRGETEVHGQFKNFLDQAKATLSSDEYKELHQIHVDAKRVRTRYLRNLGSQSYGSFCRRQVRGLEEVNLVGSGHLVRELLPWLVKTKAKIRIFCRSADQKRLEIQARFPQVTVEELFNKSGLSGALIVAAPIKSGELALWLENARIETVIDLRAESAEDPLPLPSVSLRKVFEAIEAARSKINSEVEKARDMIKELTYANQDFSAKKRSRETASVSSRTSA